MEAHIVTSPNRTLAFVFLWLESKFYLKAPRAAVFKVQLPHLGQTEIPFGGVSEEVAADFSSIGDD